MDKIAFLLIVISLYACSKPEPQVEFIEDTNLTEQQIDSILLDFSFDYENPIIVDSSHQMLIPVSTKLNNPSKRIRMKSSYSYKNAGMYWNVFFYNEETGESRLMTKEKFWIRDIAVQRTERAKRNQYLEDKILYRICLLYTSPSPRDS